MTQGHRIFVTGATGLVGRRFVAAARAGGASIVALTRRPEAAAGRFEPGDDLEIVGGDPGETGTWMQAVDGCDAIVHLAGANLAAKRWTPEFKRELVQSRVDSGRHLVEAIESASVRPRVLVSASAVGYYGDTGDRAVEDDAAPGQGFVPELVVAWEESVSGAEALGVRTAQLRFGIVLDARGGALAKMMPPFRFFVGGPLGNGRQYVAWLHWRDAVGLLERALADAAWSGAVNAVAPEPVTNRAFSQALGRAIHRPSWLPAPYLAMRLALGELADLLVMSQRVVPRRVLASDYAFAYADLHAALRDCVG